MEALTEIVKQIFALDVVALICLSSMVSFFILCILSRMGKLVKTEHVVNVVVTEKQKRNNARYTDFSDHPEDVGVLSFENGALNEYTLWLELVDAREAQDLKVQRICCMDASEYRDEWEDIPENAQGTLVLRHPRATGGWIPTSFVLARETPSNAFVV